MKTIGAKTLILGTGIAGAAALTLILATADTPRHTLRSPFPRADAIAAATAAAAPKTKCPPAPAGVRNIIAPSKFGDDRQKHDSTVIDPDDAAGYAEITKPVTDFSRRVSTMADAVADHSGKASLNARCALEWLNSWAEEDALLGEVNGTGESVRKWELATLSSAYLKIRSAPHDSEKAARVRQWLRRVAHAVRADYSRNLDVDSRSNNHLNWAAWAVMTASVAADDDDLFDWSIDRFRYALRQISSDGTLPLELKRRQLAVAYHNYALAPLIMLREGALSNGVALSREEDQRLQRLVDLVVTSFSDPSTIAAASGYPQDMTRVTSTHLAWLEPYLARSHDPRALQIVERRRPLSFSRLGGNLTVLFGDADVLPSPIHPTATGNGRLQQTSGASSSP